MPAAAVASDRIQSRPAVQGRKSLHCDVRGHHEPPDGHSCARMETAMWRGYYEKRYAALFGRLYELSRTQVGLSSQDSFRIALSAAQAPRRSSQRAPARRPTLHCRRWGLLTPARIRRSRLLRCRGSGASRSRLVAGEARSRGSGAIGHNGRPRGHDHLRRAGGRPVALDIRCRPCRSDGLSRRTRAGDDGSGLVGDRVICCGAPTGR